MSGAGQALGNQKILGSLGRGGNLFESELDALDAGGLDDELLGIPGADQQMDMDDEDPLALMDQFHQQLPGRHTDPHQKRPMNYDCLGNGNIRQFEEEDFNIDSNQIRDAMVESSHLNTIHANQRAGLMSSKLDFEKGDNNNLSQSTATANQSHHSEPRNSAEFPSNNGIKVEELFCKSEI